MAEDSQTRFPPIAWARRWRAWFSEHESFVWILALFALFRGLAVFFLQPGGFLTAATPDQFFYYNLAGINSAGWYPYLNYWLEFPPIFPWIVVLATRLSLLIPAVSSGILWFNAVLRWLMLPFEAGSLLLIYLVGLHLYDKPHALRASQAFALLFVPLWVFLGWFDSLVLFFVLLALYGLCRHDPVRAALGIGLGFGVKLFPLAVLPVAVRVFKGRRMIILGAVIALSLLMVFGPFLLANPTNTLAFFDTLQGRTSWETVWALLDGYTGYGIVAPLDIRNEASMSGWLPDDVEPSRLPWPIITAIFGAVGLFVWTRPIDWADARRSTAFGALTFGMMLLYAKGYSPQWGLYLTALSIVLLPGWRGLLYAVLVDVLTVLEWPIAFVLLDSAPSFLAGVIIARSALTVILCLEFSALVFAGTNGVASLRRLLPVVTGTGFALAALASSVPTWNLYRNQRVEADPLQPLIHAWTADTTARQVVLTTQPIVTQRLSPLLPAHVPIYQMPNGLGSGWIDPEEWLSSTVDADALDYVWLVEENVQGEYWQINRDLQAAMSSQYCKYYDQWLDTNHASVFLPDHPTPDVHDNLNFEDRVMLTGYGLSSGAVPVGHRLCVSIAMTLADPDDEDIEIVIEVASTRGGVLTERRAGLRELLESRGFQDFETEVDAAVGLIHTLPPGNYEVHLGFYSRGEDRYLQSESDEISAPIMIGEITIE